MNNEHVLIAVVGKTNSGKSSLIRRLCDRVGLRQLISYTTRPRRNEQDNDHLFIGIEDYRKAKENGDIIAETEIAGCFYYTTKEQLYNSDLYTIDPTGLEYLLSADLPNIRVVVVYISCPDEERKLRADKRGDDKNAYRTRDLAERQQFRRFVSNETWDYAIRNNDFSKAYSCLYWISQLEGVWKNNKEDNTK